MVGALFPGVAPPEDYTCLVQAFVPRPLPLQREREKLFQQSPHMANQ